MGKKACDRPDKTKRDRLGGYGFLLAAARRKIAGVLRAGAYLTVAFAVLGALAARKARADVAEAAIGVGREIVKLEDTDYKTKQVLINGESVFVSTAGTDLPVKTVLDRFEASCKSHATAMAEELAK